MQVSDEDVLQDRLAEEFGRIGTGTAPVDAAIRQGRAIRTRRRAAVGGGLAVVAVGALGSAALLGTHPAGRTVAPTRYSGPAATVATPRTDAKGDWTFSGTVDGKAWSAVLDHSSGCAMTFGTCPSGPAPADPVSFSSSSDGDDPEQYVGDLRPDVARVEVVLADGERLALQPAQATAGHRLVLFELPHGFGIARITAYRADGSPLAYSIPFNPPGGMSTIVTWYAPDAEPALPDTSTELAHGRVGDQAWSLELRTGPFGECFVRTGFDGSGTSCSPPNDPAPTTPSFVAAAESTPTWVYSEVNPSVDHFQVAFSDGATARVTPVRVDGRSFAGFVAATGVSVRSITAYDGSGHVLATDTTGITLPTK